MSLYKFSLPFSYQLFFRYFNGFDLDFTDSALNIAKGFADAKGMPNYVITATISFNRANDGLTSRVNNEKYVEFNEGSQFKDYYPEG
jgi:hypothetical protein